MSEVIYEIRGKIATVTLNRPEKLNAINANMSIQLREAFLDVRDNEDVWIMVLRANGRVFSAGRDIVERTGSETIPLAARNGEIYALLSEIKKPTIAAINGLCLAAAAGFIFCTDIRIAETSVKFAWPQAGMGISSVSGPTILARQMPENLALEYMYTGKHLSAQEALRWGLVNHVVEDGKSREAADGLALELLDRAPLSMQVMKESMIRTRELAPKEAFTLATELANIAGATQDAQEGLNAFKEKRQPRWQGR